MRAVLYLEARGELRGSAKAKARSKEGWSFAVKGREYKSAQGQYNEQYAAADCTLKGFRLYKTEHEFQIR